MSRGNLTAGLCDETINKSKIMKLNVSRGEKKLPLPSINHAVYKIMLVGESDTKYELHTLYEYVDTELDWPHESHG
jgi:hypothetical protein